MSLIASAKGNASFEICPEGVHVARCARIIDLGTQSWEHMGKPKSGRKIFIGWEMPELKDSEGRSQTVIKKYTLSLHEKADLRKDLQNWRGRAFTAAELEAFDIANLVNKPCMLNIVHERKGDKTYANVTSVIPLPGAMTAPALTGKSFVFTLSDFDAEVFDGLSNGMKNMIMASPEYAAVTGGSIAPAAAVGNLAYGDDTVPF